MIIDNSFLKVGLEACNESGKIILSYYKKYTKYSYKNKFNRDLVSEVDIIVENKIKSIIKKKIS